MKRSHTVSLVLLGAAGLAAYGLSQSGEETEAAAFHTVDECRNAGLEAATCQTSFDEARKIHGADAPRFESQADCEKDFGAGKCNPTQLSSSGFGSGSASSSSGGVGSYFVPALLGFAVARGLSNQSGQPAAQPLYSCPPDRQRPDGSCFNTSSGRSFYSGSRGSSSSSSSNSFWRSRSAYVPSSSFSRSSGGATVVSRGSSVSSVSRGGFGSTGHGFSSSSS